MAARKRFRILWHTTLAALLVAGTGVLRAEPVIHHAHGLAFSADGKSLLVPAHVGVAVYRDGRWSRAPGPAHDFMGFSAAHIAMYSSGHPAPGSPLRNPLGLVKSTDGGATWQQLALSGEADFHVMAAGAVSNAVYVVNHAPNSKMSQPGLHSTRDDGKTWIYAPAAGGDSQILALAVHPKDPATLAAGTLRGGAMLSRDGGKSFSALGGHQPVTAIVFERDGKAILYAQAEPAALVRRSLGRDSNQQIKLPQLDKDFIAFVAQNPANSKELAFVTRNRNVFLSKDGGSSWAQIAKEGEAK